MRCASPMNSSQCWLSVGGFPAGNSGTHLSRTLWAPDASPSVAQTFLGIASGSLAMLVFNLVVPLIVVFRHP
jgi:hypothetical protein